MLLSTDLGLPEFPLIHIYRQLEEACGLNLSIRGAALPSVGSFCCSTQVVLRHVGTGLERNQNALP